MKKTIIGTGIVVVAAFLVLFILNKVTSRKSTTELFTEVQKGQFEIAISSAGELMAERSVDIKGPEIAMGRDIRSSNIKIQDIVPEGTLVKEGDYIATLDRTDLNNSLKDAQENLTTRQIDMETKLLDSAVTLTGLRDGIKNQHFAVEEAAITLHNSKYEPPATIREAEIGLDKSQRTLEQLQRSYSQILAQNKTDILNQNYWISRVSRRVSDLQEVLAGFTVLSPGTGMVIYKREWNGTKRKAGSMINPFDRVIATLPDLNLMASKTFVNEIDISKMAMGLKVNITIDAFPEKKYSGIVTYIANIGEKLQNTDDKVFEVQIRMDGSDPALRPSMTTGNKIMVKTVKDAVFIPIECVQAGIDSIPYVYTKKNIRQIVLLGESNEKFVMVEKGLDPGTLLYLNNPEKPESFRLEGKELIPLIKEREKTKNELAGLYRRKAKAYL